MLNLTEEEKKRVNSEAVKYLIQITEEQIKKGYRTHLNNDLEKELDELKKLLKEI